MLTFTLYIIKKLVSIILIHENSINLTIKIMVYMHIYIYLLLNFVSGANLKCIFTDKYCSTNVMSIKSNSN